jgi:pimeloyl-ACP methyl ester carboxylesterase
MNLPKLPIETKPFLWGAVAGATALAIAGFSWGGWVTGATAERLAGVRADAAIVAALTPICVTQFQAGPSAGTSLAALKQIQSWDQANYVSNGGWATMPGSKGEPNREVAAACATALIGPGS